MSKRVLGLWNMGEGSFHKLLSPEESKAIIRRALDSQITSFDTAFSYKNADNYLSAVLKERDIERDAGLQKECGLALRSRHFWKIS